MSKIFLLQPRELPLDDQWDVIVAGGGPAGCAAAAAAASVGSRTLLIEATGSLGGMGTLGLVPAWCPFTDKERVVYGGFAEKVLRRCMGGMPHVPSSQLDWTPIDPELLKRIYDDLVTQAGATVLFHTQLAAVEAAGGKVDAVITSSKSGLSALAAKVYVDCTGDADLAAWAGAPFAKGDDQGDLQPATHCFVLANVDEYGYRHCGSVRYGTQEPVIDKIVKSGRYPEIPDVHACNNLIGPGCVGFNAGHLWKVDNTDPASVSSALMQGRRMADAYRRGLAEFFPQAFGNAFLAATGSLLGVRETRRIVGDYVLTLDDYLARRSFSDEICRNSYYIDVHRNAQASSAQTSDTRFEKHTHRYGKGESHGIPYRCLVPQKLENVLVAGRSISTDRRVQGSTRVMPVCLAMGEAAGRAAALAVPSRNVRAVDVADLRQQLRAAGGYLPDVPANS